MTTIVLYIDFQYSKGGSSQYCKSLVHALSNFDPKLYKFEIIYTSPSWYEYLIAYQNNLFFVKKSRTKNKLYQLLISFGLIEPLRFFVKLFDSEVKFINKKQYDFIVFPAQDTIASFIDNNVVGTIHDLMHIYERKFKESGSFLIYNYRQNYFKCLLKNSVAVLVDSKVGKQHVLQNYNVIENKVHILPYIPPDYIFNNINLNNFVQPEFNYIFYPAQFWKHKNHINLILALNDLINNKKIDLKLILSGEKNKEFNKINQLVNLFGLNQNVIFMGFVSDFEMANLYKGALGLVMPSYFGPTNIPPIEAIMLNCPVIVSDVYASRNQLENAALYFNPNDYMDISKKIENLFDSEVRTTLINNGKRIKNKFTQQAFRENLNSIFSKIKIV
jgi:glycosyltransferase involved in cell wall biosynthesis